MRIRILFFLILCINFSGKTQTYTLNPFQGGYFDPHPAVGGNLILNTEEFLFSFMAGMNDAGYDYYVGLEFGTRAVRRQIEVKDKDISNLYYQYHENINFFSLDLEKRFYFLGFQDKNKVGLYTGLRTGYLWGNYRGFSNYDNSKWFFSPDLGGVVTFRNTSVKLGYTLLDIPSVENNNYLNIEVSYVFNRHKND